MKRKMVIFSLFAIFALFAAQNQAYAHSHSNKGAVIAGTVAGIATGVIIGNTFASKNRYYYHPRRYYKPYHSHRAGCICCRRPVHVNIYPSYSYPGYVNYSWR